MYDLDHPSRTSEHCDHCICDTEFQSLAALVMASFDRGWFRVYSRIVAITGRKQVLLFFPGFYAFAQFNGVLKSLQGTE